MGSSEARRREKIDWSKVKEDNNQVSSIYGIKWERTLPSSNTFCSFVCLTKLLSKQQTSRIRVFLFSCVTIKWIRVISKAQDEQFLYIFRLAVKRSKGMSNWSKRGELLKIDVRKDWGEKNEEVKEAKIRCSVYGSGTVVWFRLTSHSLCVCVWCNIITSKNIVEIMIVNPFCCVCI